jgi:hypothetical protein
MSAFAAIWVAAGASAVVNERGTLLVPIAAIVSVIGLGLGRDYSRRQWAAVLVVLVIAALFVGLFAREPIYSAITEGRGLVTPRVDARRTWAYVGSFLLGFFDSAWLVGGWARLPAPRFWLILMHGISILAVVGIVRTIRTDASQRLLLTFAALFVGCLVTAVVVYHLSTMFGGALGRYLFPAAGPMSVLLWVGVRAWLPPARWPRAAAALVTVIVVFDLIGWFRVLLPAYL